MNTEELLLFTFVYSWLGGETVYADPKKIFPVELEYRSTGI